MKPGKRVVVLTQFYKPENIPFPSAVAEKLQEEGHEVSVVTGFPNRPGGKLFAGYKQRFRFSENVEGIDVHRVPLVINHSGNAVARALNFLSFSISALTATSKVKGADAVYVYATPATAAIPAQVWKKFLGIPYILHVQDIWPESVTESGMIRSSGVNGAAVQLLSSWTDRLYGNSDMLIAISEGMKDLLIKRGISPEKCAVVYNWADEETIHPKPTDSFEDDGLKVLYAGNLGPMQDLGTLLEAAELMGSETGFHLTVAGGGIMEEQIESKARHLEQVDYVGLQSPSDVSRLYWEADFQLVTLKDLPIFRVTVPSKFQASLAAGIPVITTVKGAVADLIQHYQAGLVAEPENAESLMQAFQAARQMTGADRAEMGKNARRLYSDLMSAGTGKASITRLIGEVASAR